MSSSYRYDPDSEFHQHWAIAEFSSGIRKTNQAKLYTIMFVIIRFLSVIILICFSPNDQPINVNLQGTSAVAYYIEWALFWTIHAGFSVYLVYVRPFDSWANNIIEGINQVCYTLLILPLLFLHEESDWSEQKEDLYIMGLMISPALSGIVNTIFSGKSSEMSNFISHSSLIR